jgi:CBS domain-containing protein
MTHENPFEVRLLTVVDQPSSLNEPVSLTDSFHRLGRILPEKQSLITCTPNTPASEALTLMHKHGVSQLPVAMGERVLGVFSYRSFARSVTAMGDELLKEKQLPGELAVEECMEPGKFSHISASVSELFETIDKHDVVLIGTPSRIVGVLTAIDVLRYLYGVASPFVLIAEIEITLRALIAFSVEQDVLRKCCDRCLKHYSDDKRPYALTDMTFSDYVQIVGHGESWELFKHVFGGSRVRTSTKLNKVKDLRNDVFHFRREITVQEYEELVDLRQWMLSIAERVEIIAKGASNEQHQ